MSYQYYPLKLADSKDFVSEPRLAFIRPILNAVVEDVGLASFHDVFRLLFR